MPVEQEMAKRITFDDIIYYRDTRRKNEAMALLVEKAMKIAATDAVVLITGESGTGKEMFAQAIHNASPRQDKKFVAINCAAVPESLLESELFGHEKGAFTGAVASRKGKFEQAHGGTLFLDEIGDLSLASQAKILRAIETRSVERVGGGTPIEVDIRIITATNQPLYENVKKGLFRSDLYYRLNEVNLRIPPLRERMGDIPLIADHFIRYYNRQYNKNVRGLSDAAMQFLLRHDWPGNIRELHHVIKCAMLMAEGESIWLEHIPLDVHFDTTGGASQEVTETRADELLELLTLDEVEKRHILRILEFTGWNKSQAANILQTTRPTLDRKIERYNLKRRTPG
ncbi:sigma 54-interacting transcriptional regulator [bacterium]|nr:sigma 54-interacting transcriptional regulator [bacterium]